MLSTILFSFDYDVIKSIVYNCIADRNECLNSTWYNCNANASCLNNDGSYSCQCLEGFSGDGVENCTGTSSVFNVLTI